MKSVDVLLELIILGIIFIFNIKYIKYDKAKQLIIVNDCQYNVGVVIVITMVSSIFS
jgi:hypothetical protein